MTTRKTALLGFALLAAATGVALAQSAKVYNKYKGQIVISDEPIDIGGDDAATLTLLKKVRKEKLARTQGAGAWPFYFVAFLSKKAGAADLSLFFYEKGQKDMAFYRDLQVDPESKIVAFDLEFTEDDGVKPDVNYEVALGRMEGSKAVHLAKSTVLFKSK